MSNQNTKTQTALYSAIGALRTAQASGRKVSGSFDDEIRITTEATECGTKVCVITDDLQHEVIFDKHGMVISEQLKAFTKLFGLIDWDFKVIFHSTYSYTDGYRYIVL